MVEQDLTGRHCWPRKPLLGGGLDGVQAQDDRARQEVRTEGADGGLGMGDLLENCNDFSSRIRIRRMTLLLLGQ